MKSPSPQYAIACKVLRLKLEKIAETDIRSAYGEFVMYPKVSEISGQVYEERSAGWSLSLTLMPLEEWRSKSCRPVHEFKFLKR